MQMETEEHNAFHFIAYLKAVTVAAIAFNLVQWFFILPALLDTPASNAFIWIAAFVISIISSWVFAFLLNIIPVFLVTRVVQKYKIYGLLNYIVACVCITLLNMIVTDKILTGQLESEAGMSSYGRVLPAFALAGIFSAVIYWRATHKKSKGVKQLD